MGAALADNADALITSGRRWSNHARLTAAAGAKAGLAVHLVLSGPALDPPNPGVGLAELLGATVHFTSSDDRVEREALVSQLADELRDTDHRPYVIGVGGSGVVGSVGQVLAGLELATGAAGRGFVPDELILPSATGGTQAGILVGLRTAGVPAIVRGFAVARPSDELRPAIVSMVAALGGVAGLASVPEDEIVLTDEQLGPGYGRASGAAGEATRLLGRTEGILVDPIYTAKALAGLVAMAQAGALDGRRTVFWHAGGMPALFEPPA